MFSLYRHSVAILLMLSMTAFCLLRGAEPADQQQAKDDASLQAIREKLAARVTVDGFEPNTPFKEAIGFLQERYELKFHNDDKAFEASGWKLDEAVVKLPKMVDAPFRRVLDLLADQAGGVEHTVRWRIRPDGILLTTSLREAMVKGVRKSEVENIDELKRLADLRECLRVPVSLDAIEENTPLIEALGFLMDRYGLHMRLDETAFKRMSHEEILGQPISLPPQVDTPLADVLHQLLVQVKIDGALTVRAQRREVKAPDELLAHVRLRAGIVEIGSSPRLEKCLAFSGNGKLLASATTAGSSGYLVRIWDRNANNELLQVHLPDQELSALAFTANSKHLAVLTRDRAVHDLDEDGIGNPCRLSFWNIANKDKDREHELVAGGCLALSPDGRQVLSTGSGRCRVHDPATGKKTFKKLGFKGAVTAAGFCGDGRTVACMGIEPGATRIHLSKPGTGHEPVHFRLDAAEEPVQRNSAVLSDDGRYLAVLDCLGRIELWETLSGKCLRSCVEAQGVVHHVAFAPNNRLLAGIMEVGTEQYVEVWELGAGKFRDRFCKQVDGSMHALAFSPDGKTLAAALDDGTPVIWDLLGREKPPPASRLTEEEAPRLWDGLRDESADRGHEAIVRLAAHPDQCVALLSARLRAVPASNEDFETTLDKAVSDLDHDHFVRRSQAEEVLLRLGKRIEPHLRRELNGPLPSLELRRRLERILLRLQQPVASLDVLRDLRAIDALERVATPGAQKLLASLAEGTPEAVQTQAAREALDRLKRQAKMR